MKMSYYDFKDDYETKRQYAGVRLKLAEEDDKFHGLKTHEIIFQKKRLEFLSATAEAKSKIIEESITILNKNYEKQLVDIDRDKIKYLETALYDAFIHVYVEVNLCNPRMFFRQCKHALVHSANVDLKNNNQVIVNIR